jgi:KDO2-lipid IV(A) lauroyltransferase
MSKPRSRSIDYVVYLTVRLFVCVIQALPVETACTLSGLLAWFIHRIDRRHRGVAKDNLTHAFGGGLTDAQRERLVTNVYRHFCQVLMEIIHLPRRLHAHNWRRCVELKGGRQLVDCLLSDRPLLIVTGHYGNWEMAGYTLGLLGFGSYAVARPLDNPYLDDFLHRFRQRTGQKILAKKGDFYQMRRILSEGGVLATLADQDAGERGLFVDFFGRPASTHKAIALLALEHRVPILVVLARNVGAPLRYEVVAEELILPEEYENQGDAVRVITQRFTSALERGVRRAPEQYLWLHRRWKHQPSKPKRRAVASPDGVRPGEMPTALCTQA